MQIGLIGAGNMARGLALGWGEPRAVHRRRQPRAPRRSPRRSAARPSRSNAEVARRADVVVLCHKPGQLDAVAAGVAPHAKAVVSILGGDAAGTTSRRPIPTARCTGAAQHAGRGAPGRGHPRRRRGAGRRARRGGARAVRGARHARRARRRAGRRRDGPDVQRARLLRARRRGAGRRRRAPRAARRRPARLVVQTMAGTAELLRREDYDTLAVRRAVTSPGGSTARGLDALERGGRTRRLLRRPGCDPQADDRRAGHLPRRTSPATWTRVFNVYTMLIIAYILS